MMNLKRLLTSVFCFGLITGYAQQPTAPFNVDIIPRPVEISQTSGYISIDAKSLIYLDSEFKSLANYFQEELFTATNIKFQISKKRPANGVKSIQLIHTPDLTNKETYTIDIDGETIKITASDKGGAVYAIQSLRQLVRLNNPLWGHQQVFLPQLKISDEPTYAWRGYMIDVSRTFYTLDHLKQMVDHMVKLKLNRFHIHLSDDQGFRVEMKKYKKLNTVGSWRVDHTNFDENDNSVWGRPVQKEGELANYGGYYTCEQLKDLVAYAKLRNIEVLPEIDIPGHSQAIIASYPEFSCQKDKKFTVATGGVSGNNTICPSTEATYDFIESIITELTDIFPFEYIHIGGDECHKGQWANHTQCNEFREKEGLKDNNELQSYFIHRVEKIVNKQGKKMIGWDEILDGGLAPNATVMSWRGESGGIAAAKMNHDVIMSPNHSNYLDLKQGQSMSEPNLGYSIALLSNTYNFKIAPDALTPEQKKHIIGNQGNMWTETFSDMRKISYMALPRLFAVAENAWTPDSEKSWDDFIKRLRSHMEMMEFEGVRFAKSVFNPWVHHRGDGSELKVWLTSEITNPEIRYTLNGTDPKPYSPLYKNDTIVFSETTTLKTAMFDGEEQLGDVVTRHFPFHKAANAKVIIRSKAKPEGVEQKNSKLVDLSYGEFLQGGDTHWMVFNEDADIEIIFDEATDIEAITINSLRHHLKRWYSAKQIIIYAKVDNDYKKIADTGVLHKNIERGRNIMTNRIACPVKAAKSIRIEVLREAKVPAHHVAHLAGQNTVLQIDEIVVD